MGDHNGALKPERFTLRSALECFLEFRFETLRRRANFLMKKKDATTQMDAVLRLQLGQLTRLNKNKLTKEKEALDESIAELRNLMSVDNAVWEEMLGEFDDIKDKYAVPRRTRIELDETSINKELTDMDLIENTRSVIVVTKGGYIKRLPLQTFTSQGRGTRGKKSTTATTASTTTNNDDDGDADHSGTHVSHYQTCVKKSHNEQTW